MHQQQVYIRVGATAVQGRERRSPPTHIYHTCAAPARSACTQTHICVSAARCVCRGAEPAAVPTSAPVWQGPWSLPSTAAADDDHAAVVHATAEDHHAVIHGQVFTARCRAEAGTGHSIASTDSTAALTAWCTLTTACASAAGVHQGRGYSSTGKGTA